MSVIEPGETGVDYSENWTKTFDLVFLAGWIAAFVILSAVTVFRQPSLLAAHRFIAFCGGKLAVMLLMSLAGGLACRHYCRVDEKGYILTGRDSWFKVNYTRKLQHFAAYLVPLVPWGVPASGALHPSGIIPHLWESLFVLAMFLLLIKPIRERSRFFMLQFNSLDRPEDRPHTLKWIVLGNILPGLVLGTIFKQLFEGIGEPNLVLSIVLIIGIGDGLAEPVGIYFGRRKYIVPSWGLERGYTRSYAGSACVYLAALVFMAMFYSDFDTVGRFIAAVILIPPLMTLVEAMAPHSMDTPLMMVIGFSSLYVIAK